MFLNQRIRDLTINVKELRNANQHLENVRAQADQGLEKYALLYEGSTSSSMSFSTSSHYQSWH